MSQQRARRLGVSGGNGGGGGGTPKQRQALSVGDAIERDRLSYRIVGVKSVNGTRRLAPWSVSSR